MLAPQRLGTFALVAAVVVAAALGLPGCNGNRENPWQNTKGLRVLVSFPPLVSFVKSVGGDDVTVLPLLTSEGPHNYQYHARDVLLLREADLFFTNGLSLDDHFTHKMKNSSGNSKLGFVELGTLLDGKRLLEIKDGGHQCPHHPLGSKDPHVWLGLPEAVLMVEAICKTLSTRDPANAAGYRERADIYIEKLNQLHAGGREKLAGKGVKLITQHESLAYFAAAFDLEIVGSIQLQPGDDPSTGRLVELAGRGARIVAVEPQYSENTARALLNVMRNKKVDRPVLVTIDPLETADPQELDAGWYERKMGENIDRLAKALP